MTKKYLFVGMAAMLGASLSFFACESATGGAGAAGAPGAIYLSGSQTTAGIQAAIDSGAPLVFAGVTQSDNDTVIIPAGRSVELVGTAAYTVANNAAAVLILEDATSVSGSGTITMQAAGTVIAPQSVLDDNVPGSTGKLAYQAVGTGGTLTFTSNVAAVKGNVSIKTTPAAESATEIAAAQLSGKTLYVIGGLTVSDAVSATAINVAGDVTASAAITGTVSATGTVTFSTAAQTALTGLTAGSVESAVAITTTSNGSIAVKGDLKTTVAAAAVTVDGSGTLSAGSLNLAGNLTTATGAVTVTGASVLGGDISRGTSGAYSFGGDVTLAGGKKITLTGVTAVTLKGGASIKAGTNTVLTASGGDVTITPATGAVLTATAAADSNPAKIAVSTAAIAVAGTLAVSGELEATNKDITFTVTTGILAIAPGGKVTTKAAVASGAIILGASANNGVTLTGAGSWTAGGSGVVLTNSAAKATAINKAGAAAATLTASGTPTLTVLKGSDAANVLTIGGDTEIALAGTGEAAAGSIALEYDGSYVAKIVFAAAGAKISTGLAGATTKVTATIAGGITANSGAVGNKLEVYSTTASGASLKLGSITPASDATFDGAVNAITGPTASADTTINSVLTVTAA